MHQPLFVQLCDICNSGVYFRRVCAYGGEGGG